MIRPKARGDYIERAPHERLGLGEPVGVLEEPRQIVEADGDVRVIGAVGVFVDAKRAPHERLGLGEPVGGLQELRQIVEADGDARVIGAVGVFVDAKRAPHERLGLGEPVGGLEERRQIVEVGWRRPGDRGRGCARRSPSARRMSGSASASRLVSWRSCARLLRSMATLG